MGTGPLAIRREIRATLLVWAAAAMASSCDTNVPGHREWVTRGVSAHFAYHTEPSEALACAGLLDRLEKHFSVIQAYLQFAPPSDKIDYYKFADATDMRLTDICVRGACASGSTIWSSRALHPHELVHAYLAHVGTPPSIFQEGVAVALSCDGVNDAMPSLDWRAAVLSNDPIAEPGIYEAGSRLVSYLLRRFGGAAFAQLYAALDHYAPPETVDQAMMLVYGASAEQLWQEALAAPPGCLSLWACAGDAAEPDGSPLPGESCGADEDYRTFTMPASDSVLMSFPARAQLRASACDDRAGVTPWLELGPVTDPATPHIVATDIAAGKHFVAFTGAASSISVQRLEAPVAGPECPALQPLTVGAGTYPAIHLVIPPDQAAWHARLTLDGPRLLTVALPPDVQLTVCHDCGFAASACAPLDPSRRYIPVVWSGDYALRFTRLGEITSPAQVDIVGR